MKVKLFGLLFLFCALPCFSQYATINAQLSDGSGNTSTQGFLHFDLSNCGNNFPVVSNSLLTPVRTSFDITPNQPNGSILGQVLGNDVILCGGVASTQWRVTLMKDRNTAPTETEDERLTA